MNTLNNKYVYIKDVVSSDSSTPKLEAYIRILGKKIKMTRWPKL